MRFSVNYNQPGLVIPPPSKYSGSAPDTCTDMVSRFEIRNCTASMVIVQFRGRLVRQYRACVIDSLGLEITCQLDVKYGTNLFVNAPQ